MSIDKQRAFDNIVESYTINIQASSYSRLHCIKARFVIFCNYLLYHALVKVGRHLISPTMLYSCTNCMT